MDADADATCRFLQQHYGVKPHQSWGRLKDLDLRAYWDKHGCNARVVQAAPPPTPRLPVHAYWGNWHDTPFASAESVQLFKQSKGAAFINSFWDLSKECHVTGRNLQQEEVLRSNLGSSCTVLAGVGGWGSTTPWAMLTRDKPTQMAASLASAVNDAGFQGIAVDWEYPNSQDEWNSLLDFCKAYKQQAPHHIIAIAVGAELSVDADWPALGAAVDWMHVMSYDYTGSWNSKADHNSSVSQGIAALKAYERAGVPRSKLMMGSAWYGRQCKAQTLGAPASGPWLERTYADIAGSPLVPSVLGPGWTRHRDADGTPWLANERTGQVLTFEDPECLKAKLEWVQNNGFGGVFCWEWGHDNASGDMQKCLLQI